MNVTSEQFENVLRGVLTTGAAEIEQKLRKVNDDIEAGNFVDAYTSLLSLGIKPAFFNVMEWACMRHDTEKKAAAI